MSTVDGIQIREPCVKGLTSLQRCCEKYGFQSVSLPKDALHQAGSTYWCAYWQTWYKVLSVTGDAVTCLWEDGHTNTHMTSLDSLRDKELLRSERYEKADTACDALSSAVSAIEEAISSIKETVGE